MMPARRVLCAMAALAALVCAPARPLSPPRVHLVHATSAGHAFTARPDFPAGQYLAMYCERDCALRPARLRIERASVPTSDGTSVPGFIARTDASRPALFLVRGLPALEAGPVRTWYVNRRFQAEGAAVTGAGVETAVRRVSIDGVPLEISAHVRQVPATFCNTNDCPSFPRVTWRMRFEGVERTLAVLSGDELGTPLPIDDFIVWIGDLDGDGKPDLVVRPQTREDYLEMSLFLSSTLRPHRPWTPSGHFYFWDPTNPGC